MDNFTEQTSPLGLYDPQFEHDATGIVLKLGIVQAEGRGLLGKIIHCLSHPFS